MNCCHPRLRNLALIFAPEFLGRVVAFMGGA